MLSVVVQEHDEENHPASLDLHTERFSFHFRGTKIKDFDQVYATP